MELIDKIIKPELNERYNEKAQSHADELTDIAEKYLKKLYDKLSFNQDWTSEKYDLDIPYILSEQKEEIARNLEELLDAVDFTIVTVLQREFKEIRFRLLYIMKSIEKEKYITAKDEVDKLLTDIEVY